RAGPAAYVPAVIYRRVVRQKKHVREDDTSVPVAATTRSGCSTPARTWTRRSARRPPCATRQPHLGAAWRGSPVFNVAIGGLHRAEAETGEATSRFAAEVFSGVPAGRGDQLSGKVVWDSLASICTSS